MDGNQHNSEKEEGELSSDDDYQSKLSEMQTYIPFLQQMIQRLEQSNDKSREAQLSKMKSLYGILNNTKKRLKVDTLKRCEDVLRNLMNKVEKSSSHKDGGKMRKKNRELSFSSRITTVSDSSSSSPRESSPKKQARESDNLRVSENVSEHEAVVSSTTQSCESENSVTDVVKALKLAAARNTLRSKLENVKTVMHSPSHCDDLKGAVSSSSSGSSSSPLISSSSPKKQNLPDRNDKEGLEQSRERLKKLMGHQLVRTSPPLSQSPGVNTHSPKPHALESTSFRTEWMVSNDKSWEHESDAQAVGKDNCSGQLFTRRDGRRCEQNRVLSGNNNTFQDDSTKSMHKNFNKLSMSERQYESPRSTKQSLSITSEHSKTSSPECDRNDRRDVDSPHRLRAKLEQEIHKVHKVGVSVGGALRSLATKGNNNNVSNKEKTVDKFPKNMKCENVEKQREVQNKLEVTTSDLRSPDIYVPASTKTGLNSTEKDRLSKGRFSNEDGKNSDNSSSEIFSMMSHEELHKIVSKNLCNLPSPPPITKDILETVKVSPKFSTKQKSEPQSSTPRSPDDVFHTSNFIHLEEHAPSLQKLNTVRSGNSENFLHSDVKSEITVDKRFNVLQSQNMENLVTGTYQRVKIDGSEYDSRSNFIKSCEPQSVFQRNRENSQSQNTFNYDESKVLNHQNIEDIRPFHQSFNSSRSGHYMDDTHQMYPHSIEDPRMSKIHSYRNETRNEFSHKTEELRPGGERRRGLLPTPTKFEPFIQMGQNINSRAHVQDVSSRYDQRSLQSDHRNNPQAYERMNWETSHWNSPDFHSPTQSAERYQQQMYHVKDTSQMNLGRNEAYSTSVPDPTYHWGSVDGLDTQQAVIHNSYLTCYQPQTLVDHTSDPIHSNPHLGTHYDPRLAKDESRKVTSEARRGGDPRLAHTECRSTPPNLRQTQPLAAVSMRSPSISERDPRRRSIDENDVSKQSLHEKVSNTKTSQPEYWRSNYVSSRSERSKKNTNEKDKDSSEKNVRGHAEEDFKTTSKRDSSVLSSPLESLYNTSSVAKTGKGYGLQSFRIPKIKREPLIKPRPPTPPRPAPPKETLEDIPIVKEVKTEEMEIKEKRKECDEVASDPSQRSSLAPKELTEEFIESLIRKTFESGEGKQLFEHTRFFETLSENLKNKKIRQIKRILESDSEDNESDTTQKEVDKGEGKTIEKEGKDSKINNEADKCDSNDEHDKLETKKKSEVFKHKVLNDNSEPDKIEETSANSSISSCISKDTEVGSQDVDESQKDESKPPKKVSAKRRNSLELLQQDVRDMFIREGVVTATGYRMCRLLKEVQSGASFEEISKSEVKRMEDEVEEELESPTTTGNTGKGKKGRGNTKKKKGNKNHSKTAMETCSDNETPVVAMGSKKRIKQNKPVLEDSDSDSSQRRSKSRTSHRILEFGREPVRQRRVPRIILEKADISNYRIGVNYSTDNEGAKHKMKGLVKNRRRSPYRLANGRWNGRRFLDDSVEDNELFHIEPFVYRRKKQKKAKLSKSININDVVQRLHTSELPLVSLKELFSMDCASSKDDSAPKVVCSVTLQQNDANSATFKETSHTNDKKEVDDFTPLSERLEKANKNNIKFISVNVGSNSDHSEEENDENSMLVQEQKSGEPCNNSDLADSSDVKLIDQDSTSASCTKSVSLNQLKRKVTQKRKKSYKWKLGIIKKKSCVQKSKSETGFVEENEFDRDDCNDTVSNNDIEREIENHSEQISNVTQFDGKPSDSEINKEKEVLSAKSNKVYTEKQCPRPDFTDLNYAFHFEAKQTVCILCSYEGRAIVQHYKQFHPDSEVLISRLPIDEACRASSESQIKGYNESFCKELLSNKSKGPGSFLCRFCNYKAQYAVNFYEHTSSHTGEYRYQCCKCPYMSASRTTFKGHFYNHHPKNKLKQGLNLKVLTEGPSNNAKFIFGYLCSKCNFVQLLKENILKHISLRHTDDQNVKAICINMSKTSSLESSEVSEEASSCVDPLDLASDADESDIDVDVENDVKILMSVEPERAPESSEGCEEEVKHVADKDKKCTIDKQLPDLAKPVICERKAKVLEAFVPVSTEVDSNDCIILKERVNRINDLLEKVNLNAVLANLCVSEEDPDILLVIENKLPHIKLEESETERKIIASNVDVSIEDCIKKEQEYEVTDQKEREKNVVSNSEKNDDSTEIRSKFHSQSSIPAESVYVPEIEAQDSILENEANLIIPDLQTKTCSRKRLDITNDSSKLPFSHTNENLLSKDSISRRCTRSVLRPDDDRSVMSDDSGCETSNCEIIEITDESDLEEDEQQQYSCSESRKESIMENFKLQECHADEGVSLHGRDLIEKLTKHLESKYCLTDIPFCKTSMDYEKGNNTLPPKPPPLAVSLNKEGKEENKGDLKFMTSIIIASLEARHCQDDTVLFSCLVSCCVFSTLDVHLMEKHLTRTHKSIWWNGVCKVCAKRVYGESLLGGTTIEHKYPLSFALDHLITVHLRNLNSAESLKVQSSHTTSEFSNESSNDGSSSGLHNGSENSLKTNVNNEIIEATTKYIRTRRLSGDKLSSPTVFPGVLTTPFPALESSSDSVDSLPLANDIENKDANNDLPFLKIESVVSLHPSAGNNVEDSFMGKELLGSTSSSLVTELPKSSSSNLLMTTCISSSSQENVCETNKLLDNVPAVPAKGKIQLVSISGSSGSVCTVSPSVSASNIPQPFVSLAQLIRPGTRIVVPKERASSAVPQLVGAMAMDAVLIAGNTTLPTILPKPSSTYFINHLNKTGTTTAVMVQPSLVVSNSLATSSIVLPSTTSSNPQLFKAVSLLPAESVKQVSTGDYGTPKITSEMFVNYSCSRTSHFLYKRNVKLNQVPTSQNTRAKLVHKMSKTFEQAKASKLPSIYKKMLAHDKLRHLFKCMAKHCYYTTDSPEFFEIHCWRHINLYQNLKCNAHKSKEQNKSGPTLLENQNVELEEIRKIETGGWPQCAYCCTLHETPSILSRHVQEEHGHCLYQCAFCFFRAVTYSYVVLHQNTNHTDMRITVLMCRKLPNLIPPPITKQSRKKVVLPYICKQVSCSAKFWNPAAFWRHLENSHANMTYFVCHLCNGQYVKSEKLLLHYKLHCHCYYQCQYCRHGTDTEEDMRHHLCNFHPNQKAIVIMRASDPNVPALGSEKETSLDLLKTIDIDEGLPEDNLICPPVPTAEFVELASDFWKCYKAFADENDYIDTNDKDLLQNSSLSVPSDPLHESNVTVSKDNLSETNINAENIITLEDSDTDEENMEINAQDNLDVPSPVASKQSECDNDNDVMIVGSDDEVIPRKRPKVGIQFPLDKSNPNYEPVVILRHRNPNSQVEVDPLASEVIENSDENCGNLKEPSPDRQRKGFRNRSLSIQDIETIDNGNTDDRCGSVESHNSEECNAHKIYPSACKDKAELNKPETESPKKCLKFTHRDSVVDPNILAESAISPEELEKTGASGEDLYRCGNLSCTFGAPTATQLRDHLFICDLSRDSIGLTCVHCQRQFKQITPYLEHLKQHGTCRYKCFMCKFRAPLAQQVIKHLKQKHRIYNSIVFPIHQKNTDPEKDLFVVCSKDKSKPKMVPHIRNKRFFNPDEVNFLPTKCISYHPLTCSVCSFRSKVISNMRRHLNFHNNKSIELDEIPLSDPVNPVPCLEKKEMMFDKMTNLAASSHPLGRMGSNALPNHSSERTSGLHTVPKFVPENERYVCGSPGCNYLTCDETMLRCHMRALHCDETSYRCPHCPETMQKDVNGLAISVDRMGAHLKMHDNKLYKCVHCSYYHFQRHIVERHLADKHPEKRPFVHVIREEGEVLNSSNIEEISSSVDGHSVSSSLFTWMCGLCNQQFASRSEVYEHASSIHNIKSQYKCGMCTFRSSSRSNCENHFYSRHPDHQLNLVTVCQKVNIDQGNPQVSNNFPNTSELIPKRFDTTPLWLRNMARIRHIRGILLEDEEETRMHLQMLDESSPKKLKVKEHSSCQLEKDIKITKKQDLEEKFASYGKPFMGNYVCTLCNKYKTKFKSDMKEHLYRELNYVKWMCQHCNLASCTKQQILKHSKIHEKDNKTESIIALEPDNETELWVETLLREQRNEMKGPPDTFEKLISSPITIDNLSSNAKDEEGSSASILGQTAPKRRLSEVEKDESEEKQSKRKIYCSEKEYCQVTETFLPVDSLQKGVPSKEPQNKSVTNNKKSSDSTKLYSCKHCKAKFAVARGLKIHVRLAHLRLGSYNCGYCKRSAYSELTIKQHCKSSHPHQPELCHRNKESPSIKLDNDFWEKEYGIPPKVDDSTSSKKGRKGSAQLPVITATLPATSVPSNSSAYKSASTQGSSYEDLDATTSNEISDITISSCLPEDSDDVILIDEISKNDISSEYGSKLSSIRNPEMRLRIQKQFKCGHCDFEAVREYELKKHSAKAHPSKQVRILQKQLHSSSEIIPSKVPQIELAESKRKEDEKDSFSSTFLDVNDTLEVDSENKKLFRCYYCPLRATSLGSIHKHWETKHKGIILSINGVSKNGLPFRYKEVKMSDLLKGRNLQKRKPTIYMCSYCNKKGPYTSIVHHQKLIHKDKHSSILGIVTQYECGECQMITFLTKTLKKHFEMAHPGKEFRYMVRNSSIPLDVSSMPERGEKKIPEKCDTPTEESSSTNSLEIRSQSSERPKFVCKWCSEICVSEETINFHHSMYHSHLELKFTVISPQSPQKCKASTSKTKIKKYKCSVCNFDAFSINAIYEHLQKHCQQYKCGYCDQLFKLPYQVRDHISVMHTNQTPKIISLRKTASDLVQLKRQVIVEYESEESTDVNTVEATCPDKQTQLARKRVHAFARKSTSMKQRVLSVARKSTNPCPNSYSKTVQMSSFAMERSHCSLPTLEEFSHYGKKPPPLDLKKIRTTFNYGGVNVQVNVANMTQIFNLDPIVLVKDLKTQWKI